MDLSRKRKWSPAHPYAMFKIWLKYKEFESIKNPSKIIDICGFLAGLDDDFDVPDWGWCP